MGDMQATQLEWSNQRQGDSICIKKYTYMEMIGTNANYNPCQVPYQVHAAKCKLQSTTNFRYHDKPGSVFGVNISQQEALLQVMNMTFLGMVCA